MFKNINSITGKEVNGGKIMKIAIAGAGAMGCRFGYMLSEAGNEVTLIDQWEDHVKIIKKDGLSVNVDGKETKVGLPVYLPSELENQQLDIDLVILFTKALQLANMLQAIQPILNKSTNVLCLLNGIGHEETVERYVPRENIFIGNTMWTAGIEGPGKVKLFGSGNVELQNLLPEGKETALEIVHLLSEAGLNAKYSDHVLHSIYRKACVNGTLNGLCTILDGNIATIGNTSVAEHMIRTIVDEFADVAEKEGVTLDREAVISQIKATFDPNGIGKHYPSMYQDLILNNRLTEIDYINGAIVRKGKKYGIDTPYCAFLTELVHCKEEMLGAK